MHLLLLALYRVPEKQLPCFIAGRAPFTRGCMEQVCLIVFYYDALVGQPFRATLLTIFRSLCINSSSVNQQCQRRCPFPAQRPIVWIRAQPWLPRGAGERASSVTSRTMYQLFILLHRTSGKYTVARGRNIPWNTTLCLAKATRTRVS